MTDHTRTMLLHLLRNPRAPAFASGVLIAAMTGPTADAAATLDHTAAATLDHTPNGTTQGGQAVDMFTMTNEHGMRVRFLSFGGVSHRDRITHQSLPDAP
jgi:hypothetical protein